MSDLAKSSASDNYFSGGLAEIIASPSQLTYSFLKDWMCGNKSIGKAMKLLNLPYEKTTTPILEIRNGELLVNLSSEEKTLYAKTFFTYRQQLDIHQAPVLTFSMRKLLSITCIANTIHMILVQSTWIANPQASIALAKQLVAAIPDATEHTSMEEIDILLGEKVWPNVIAVGLLSEFYHQLAIKEKPADIVAINTYIGNALAKRDWFFRSIADQLLVKQQQQTFEAYMHTYGIRADKDYELATPRWHEIPDIIRTRIEASPEHGEKDNSIVLEKRLMKTVEVAIQLQLLRSEAKRKALVHIDTLRSIIKQKTTGIPSLDHLTKETILNHTMTSSTIIVSNSQVLPVAEQVTSGKGMSVSQGKIKGHLKHITDNDMEIPKGTIGIFPNASPEFAIQYSKCAGMVFLKGGQTSHGAIVAREFGIPAIIARGLHDIPDGSQLEIDGTSGEWQIL